jgi:hypothetical protein
LIQVYDKTSGVPIKNAPVVISWASGTSTMSVTTDSNGMFDLNFPGWDLFTAPEFISIRIDANGYKPFFLEDAYVPNLGGTRIGLVQLELPGEPEVTFLDDPYAVGAISGLGIGVLALAVWLFFRKR